MSGEAVYLVKQAHVGLALVSAAGFILRMAWIALGQAHRLRHRWVRVAPHLVDTLLLVAGVILAVSYSLSPLQHPWFAAKLLLLVAYVASGGIVIRRARRDEALGIWPILALACLALIFASALTHRPLGLPG